MQGTPISSSKLFGEDFNSHMKALVDSNESMSSSIQAFIEIGRDRNRLIHQDFASFPFEKTSREIYDMYRSAAEFVEWFPGALRRFSHAALPDTRTPAH